MGQTGYALKESILNLEITKAGLKDTISVNDKKMRKALDNINVISSHPYTIL